MLATLSKARIGIETQAQVEATRAGADGPKLALSDMVPQLGRGSNGSSKLGGQADGERRRHDQDELFIQVASNARAAEVDRGL